ncbi:MAG: Fic family protein [Sulfurovum sp.]|nr:Fic family protein [Sulfurovum sp.]
MKRGLIGYYEESIVAGESVRVFVPDVLPPKEEIILNAQRQCLLERATMALGRLDSITLLLPDPDIFLYSYVRQEAVLSSQIEGTQSSLSDLLLYEADEAPGVPFDDVVEVSRYVAALDHGLKRLNEGFPLCNRLFREMHEILLSHGRGSGKQPGEFRRSQNWIGGTRPGNAHFVPPPPHKVEACMGAFEKFLHDNAQPYPALIKAALAHVQFETIHPFLDGNGRLGRLIISFILHHEGLLAKPLLYLSLYFKEHRSYYYELLNQVREDGDWEAWLDFFLEGVEQTAIDAVNKAQMLVKVIKEDEASISGRGRGSSSMLRCLQALSHRPINTITGLCDHTHLSYPSVSKAITRLQTLGIVTEITGKERNRVYCYERFLGVLNGEIEI